MKWPKMKVNLGAPEGLGYESPVNIIYDGIKETFENGIMKATLDAGFEVDKEELEKALAYDRNQYAAGFSAATERAARCLSVITDCLACPIRQDYCTTPCERAWINYFKDQEYNGREQ